GLRPHPSSASRTARRRASSRRSRRRPGSRWWTRTARGLLLLGGRAGHRARLNCERSAPGAVRVTRPAGRTEPCTATRLRRLRLASVANTLAQMIAQSTHLDERDAEWLHQLVGDWQVVADLAFADLVLWLPTDEGDFVAAAHCRPSTAATVHYQDIVGDHPSEVRRALMEQTMADRGIHVRADPQGRASLPMREVLLPVVHGGRVLGVLTREVGLPTSRVPSRLDVSYIEIAHVLCGMISRGEFPQQGAPTGQRRGAPRV